MASRHHHLLPTVVLMLALAAACAGTDEAQPAQPAGTTAGAPASTAATTTPTASTAGTEATESGDSVPSSDQLHPDVLSAEAELAADGTWTISATLSSPYDSPERYADAWRALAPDGTELGIRLLGHDHATEQPFTRNQSGIEIPADVDLITIQGRDQVNGWGGATVDVPLSR